MSILLRRRAYKLPPPVVTYTPILPDDTAKYPMYLKGWAKYTANGVTSTASSGAVGVIDTGVRGAHPSTCYSSVYDGCENTKALSAQPDKSVKYGYATDSYRDRIYIKDTDITPTDSAWNAYLAEHPVDILYELETSDDSVWFAVTDGTNYGYYCPASGEFAAVYGMTGTVIQRVEYASFSGSQYVTTGYRLTGADTVEIDFSYRKSGDNIFGSWKSNNADVFSLYASTSRSYVRYGSSLYRETSIPLNTRTTYRMTPTGDYLDGVSCNTWTQLDFNTGKYCIVGWLDGSSSPKLEGDVYEFTIENHVHLLPVKIGSSYYLFDALRWEIPAHTGTLDGGTVTGEPIPWPSPVAPTGDSVLFDSGYVDGIGWSANLLTRPNYTTYTSASLSAVETDGYMSIGITSGSSSSLSYNCHVATTNKITIPADATKMIVKAQRIAGSQAVMKFGLLGDDYTNSCSGDGGVMSAAQYPTGTTADFTLNLPAGFAGSSDYRAVINIHDAGGAARTIHISKVWFESGSAPLTMGNPFSPEPDPEPGPE